MSNDPTLAKEASPNGRDEASAHAQNEQIRLLSELLRSKEALIALQQAHAAALESAIKAQSQLQQERARAERAERGLTMATQTPTAKTAHATEPGRPAREDVAASGPATAGELENEQLRRSLAQTEAEVQRHRRTLAEVEDAVEKARDTLSFRLGYMLIHAPKSWQALRRLPGDLLELHREAKRRGEAKRSGSSRYGRERTPSALGTLVPSTETARAAEAFAQEAMRLFAAQGIDAAALFVERQGAGDYSRALALTKLAKTVKSHDPVRAKALAERAYALEPVPYRAKWLAFLQYDVGELKSPAALLATLPSDFTFKPSEKTRITEILGLSRLQSKLPVIPPVSARAYVAEPTRTMYVAASSLPFHVSGYTVRTQELLRGIAATGWQMRPVLRPGYPEDRGVKLSADDDHHVVEGISYERVQVDHGRKLGHDQYIRAAAAALLETAQELRPAVVHAASNHVNALPALIAARKLGVPFVYEVRGMWELTAATKNVGWEQSERFHLERELETLVARNADHVLTLTQGLATELIARGVAPERIEVVPNCVDPTRFTPRPKDSELMLRFGLSVASFTLVYAGSVLHYEGLDDLVRAVARLVSEGLDLTLVIAGDGEALESLQQLAFQLQIDRRVKLVGRLRPHEVPDLWSLADAAAFPRKPFPVCQLVSPLKPLEPMAMAIPVVVSDVAALREMVRDGETGLVHEAGNPISLAGKLRQLIEDTGLRERLGRAARETVIKERTWQVAGEQIVALYRRLQRHGRVQPVPLRGTRSSMTVDEKALLQRRIDEAYALGGALAARDLATRQAAGRSPRFQAYCLMKAAYCCQRASDPQAAQLAREALACDESPTNLRGLARILYGSGAFTAASEIVDRLERNLGALTGKDDELARELRGRTRLLALLKTKAAPAGEWARIIGRSVYFLHFSLPYTSVGYATRSHGLIVGMRAAGCDVRAYTRSGFPFDTCPELGGRDIPDAETIDGVEYRRILGSGRRGTTESEYLLASVDAYERVLRAERPEVVHAASNYVTALPALIAARRLGLPFIYEIRGFWEITRSSRDKDFESSTRFSMMLHFETLVAKEADHVYTLTSAMRDELVRRGIESGKITLVHNGVDSERFVPLTPSAALGERLGLPPGVPVIGYVGSFVDYEGLDDLISACSLLARRGVDFRLLMVGDGVETPKLRELIAREELADRVLLTGRVPHGDVEAYYSLIDICPFPRKPWEVCEMVSPLKPFEAMAMEKAVVVSSTRALREIVEHDRTGLVFEKGSATSLASCLEQLLLDTALRARLARMGREWALGHRTWRESGRVAVAGYRALLAVREVHVGGAKP